MPLHAAAREILDQRLAGHVWQLSGAHVARGGRRAAPTSPSTPGAVGTRWTPKISSSGRAINPGRRSR